MSTRDTLATVSTSDGDCDLERITTAPLQQHRSTASHLEQISSAIMEAFTQSGADILVQHIADDFEMTNENESPVRSPVQRPVTAGNSSSTISVSLETYGRGGPYESKTQKPPSPKAPTSPKSGSLAKARRHQSAIYSLVRTCMSSTGGEGARTDCGVAIDWDQ